MLELRTFKGKEITNFNLKTIKNDKILLYGGSENCTLGLINVKECIYLDLEGNIFEKMQDLPHCVTQGCVFEGNEQIYYILDNNL